MAKRTIWMELPSDAMWWCPRERIAWNKQTTQAGALFSKWVDNTRCWVATEQREVNPTWMMRPNRNY